MHPDKIRLVAILCPANQMIDRYLYVNFLGDRIQRMVDASEDPREAVARLQEKMYRTGLVMDAGHCPTDKAGNYLIWNNPAVEEKLCNLRVFQSIGKERRVPSTDNLTVRRELEAEKHSPMDGLLSWVHSMGAVP